MKTRAYVTRFARIISNSLLPDQYKVSKEDLKNISPQSIGPATRKLYTDVLSVGLSCRNNLGNLLIYPVREADVYVLSINGKSQICISNQKLYKQLSKKGFITPSAELQELFREYAMLDFEAISKHISDSHVQRITADEVFIRHLDVFSLEASLKGNFFIFVPCCFEDKTLVQAFFKTSSLNGCLLEEFDKVKLHQFNSCFNIPSEVFTELFEELGI